MTASSSLRQDQARAVRVRICEATLRVIERGAEPTMRAVAQAAQISERTLYRYYSTLEELRAAVMPLLRERASAPMAANANALPDYVSRLFTTFDDNAQLARALASASWVPTEVTRPANLKALRTIIDEAFPDASRAARESAAASLRPLYSAAGWAYLADCGFGLKASIRHVRWITKTVLDALAEQSGASHD